MGPTNVTINYPREEEFRTKLNKLCQAKTPKLTPRYLCDVEKVDSRDVWTARLTVDGWGEWLGQASSVCGSREAAAKLAFLAFESDSVEIEVGEIDDLD